MGQRIDVALTARGLVRSRSRAKMLIAEGKVFRNGLPVTKPAEIAEDCDMLTVEDIPFVGRGGLKLAGALDVFPLDLQNRVCMDIGASTGGFTDCMLRNGAAKVFAIDVGHGQLDDSLCRHPDVLNLEGTDIRSLHPADLPAVPDFAGIDVSFISLRLVLPKAFALLADTADCVALVKPQFEAGRAQVGKHGIVKSVRAHVQVLSEILMFSQEIGFVPAGLCVSPVQGGDGNTEYLLWLVKGRDVPAVTPDLHALVRSAGLQ